MKKQIVTAIGAALLGFAGMSANAGEITIDLFSTGQVELEDTVVGGGGLSSSVLSAGGDILGGERDLFVELLDQGGLGGDARIGVEFGAMSFSVDSLAKGTATIQWDGIDGSPVLNPTGLGGLDLSGAVNFEVATLFSDLGYEFIITAFTDATTWTAISFAAHAVNSTTLSFIPLSAFDNIFLCGTLNPAPDVNSITCGSSNTAPVNWANLGALQLQLNPNGTTTSVDVTLDSVKAVPAPSTLASFGLGLLIAGLMYRRRESSAG